MRSDFFVALSIFLLLNSCGKPAGSDIDTDNSPAEKKERPVDDWTPPKGFNDFTSDMHGKLIDWRKYDVVYECIDEVEELEQYLGVRWISEDTIAYQIFCKSMTCDSEYSGTAVNRFLDGDPETDEDGEEAYPCSEYRVKGRKAYKTWSIRIEQVNYGRAKLSLGKTVYDECDPDDQKVMRKKRGV